MNQPSCWDQFNPDFFVIKKIPILPNFFEKPKFKIWSGSRTRLDNVIQSNFWILFSFWKTHFQDLIQSDPITFEKPAAGY